MFVLGERVGQGDEGLKGWNEGFYELFHLHILNWHSICFVSKHLWLSNNKRWLFVSEYFQVNLHLITSDLSHTNNITYYGSASVQNSQFIIIYPYLSLSVFPCSDKIASVCHISTFIRVVPIDFKQWLQHSSTQHNITLECVGGGNWHPFSSETKLQNKICVNKNLSSTAC